MTSTTESTITGSELAAAFTRLRSEKPLVQALTNYVAAGFTANVLLAAGASPAMIDDYEEVAVFVHVADAVLINLGTPQSALLASYIEAAKTADGTGTPWVLDPIGAGGLPWRSATARQLLEYTPTVIRANGSEVIGLAGDGSGGKGVDSSQKASEARGSAESLLAQARVVAASGEQDLILGRARPDTFEPGAYRSQVVIGGSELLTRVTGTGCSLGALVAAYTAVADPFVAAAAAHIHVAIAAERASRVSASPGSFAVAYLDALDQVREEDFEAAA